LEAMESATYLSIAQVLLFLNTVSLVVLGTMFLNLRKIRGSVAFSMIIYLTAVWSFAYLMELSNPDPDLAVFWFTIKHVPICLLPVMVVIFSIDYTRIQVWPKSWTCGLIFLPALVLFFLSASNSVHHLHFSSVRLNEDGFIPGLVFDYGILYYLVLLHGGIAVISSMVLLVRAMRKDVLTSRISYLIPILAFAIPMAGGLLEQSIRIPGLPIDQPLVLITVSEVIVFWGFRSSKLFEIRPIAFDRIMETIEEGIIVADSRSMIVDMNSTARKLLGLGKGEVIARHMNSVLKDHRWMLDWSGTREIKKEMVHVLKDERTILRLRSMKMLDRDGHFIGTLMLIKDVTEEETSRSMLKGYNDLLAMINKVLRHDLQNDLWAMELGIQMFERSKGHDSLQAVANTIHKSKATIKRMTSLEQEYLRSGKLSSFDLSAVLHKVGSENDIDIRVKGNAAVMADEAIYSVFNNLAANSIKHGGATRVSIEVMDQKDRVKVVFEDDGHGIPTGVLDSVFKEGYTFGPAGGTGYGLNIVRRNMERYGGSITVVEKDKGGARFDLLFRRA